LGIRASGLWNFRLVWHDASTKVFAEHRYLTIRIMEKSSEEKQTASEKGLQGTPFGSSYPP